MFKAFKLASSFAVKDVAAARAFYGGTLGLDVRDAQEPGLMEIHGTGGTPILVYPKPDHEQAVFTILNIRSGSWRRPFWRARQDSDARMPYLLRSRSKVPETG
jgi:catechol 2,3-dioxygenase-like lactoylglutathione lyase family enzyme